MLRRPSLILAIICVSACGCAEFEHPLSPPEKAQLDQEVFGTWVWVKKNQEGKIQREFLHIGAADPSKGLASIDLNFSWGEQHRDSTKIPFAHMTRVVSVSQGDSGEMRCSSWLAYPTQFGKLKYANVPLIDEHGNVVSYLYWKYELDGDKLSVWGSVADKGVNQLINAGKLHRSSKGNGISESSQELEKLLTNGGDAVLFPVEGKVVFRRVKLAE